MAPGARELLLREGRWHLAGIQILACYREESSLQMLLLVPALILARIVEACEATTTVQKRIMQLCGGTL